MSVLVTVGFSDCQEEKQNMRGSLVALGTGQEAAEGSRVQMVSGERSEERKEKESHREG